MTKTGCLFLGVISFLTSVVQGMDSRPTASAIRNFNIPVRVLLERGSRSAQVRSSSNRLYLKVGTGPGWSHLASRVNVTLKEDRHRRKIYLDDSPVDENVIYLRGGPHPSDVLLYRAEKFRGALKFLVTPHGLLVTNVLPLEDYLIGSLASEMSPSWEIEALKAQAIASRTYAYYRIRHPRSPYYDLDKSTQDQVYTGADAENARVLTAVNSTRGEFLASEGKPIKAYYHSRCGGTTETPKAVWRSGEKGMVSRVRCPFCQGNPYTWRATFSMAEILRLTGLPASGDAIEITPLERTPSGRIAELRLASGGHQKTMTSDEFRGLLGYTRLKSALFNWRLTNRAILFEGRGAGHGVGMCQWGARYFARKGMNYAQILGHYYPGVTLYRTPGAISHKRLD